MGKNGIKQHGQSDIDHAQAQPGPPRQPGRTLDRLAGGGKIRQCQQAVSQKEHGRQGEEERGQAAKLLMPVSIAIDLIFLIERLSEPVDGAPVGLGRNHDAQMGAVHQIGAPGAAVGKISVGMVPFQRGVRRQIECLETGGIADKILDRKRSFTIPPDFFIQALGQQVVVQPPHLPAVAALPIDRTMIGVGPGDTDGIERPGGVTKNAQTVWIDERQAFQVLVTIV